MSEPVAPSITVESWLGPARIVGGLLAFAVGAGLSWASLNSKAEAAQQSAANANAAVQHLGETLGHRMDALEASTSQRLQALEAEQRQVREAQIRSEERLQSVDARTIKIDNRLEVLLDRTNPRAGKR